MKQQKTGNRIKRSQILALGAAALAALAGSADGATFFFFGPGGLAAEAEFTLVNATTLQIRLRNTSLDVPDGFDEADQLLTGLSWELPDGIQITGGSALTGPSSASVNFDGTNVGANADVGGEWGYGNAVISGHLRSFISGNASGLTLFGGPNLDGPAQPDGPQGGLYAASEPIPLSGLGGIKDEIVATVTTSSPLANLNFVTQGLLRVEFGSDAAFLNLNNIPTPGAVALSFAAGLVSTRRRRFHAE